MASTSDNERAADIFAKRFTPNYAVAFVAWLETDPLNDPDAPAGPIFMPEYRSPLDEKAAGLDEQASHAFEEGALARDRGEEFVRVTVFLAMVLFLIAMSQRFKIRNIRIGLDLGGGGLHRRRPRDDTQLPPAVAGGSPASPSALPRTPAGGAPEVDDLGDRGHQEQLSDQHLHHRERLARVR